MKKMFASILALSLVLSLAALASAETAGAPAPAEGRLVITGTGTTSLEADMATIEIGASTRGQTVSDAHQGNAGVMEQLIAEMAKLGIAKEDIRTSQYNVYFEQDPNTYGTTELPLKGSYVVTNMVSITIRDIEKVSAAIDTASAAGANNIYNLIFQSTKSGEAYHEALRRAVADARAKAEVLALANGRTLGAVVRVESGEAFNLPGGMMLRENYTGGDAAKATPILSGDVSLTASVTLTFELK